MKARIATSARQLLPLALLLVLPASVLAQSASQVLMTALERHDARMEGIESYRVVQEAMGFELEVTFERTEVDGRTVFVPVLPAAPDGEAAAGPTRDPAGGIADFYRNYPLIAERAKLDGKASVDGLECHVVRIDDFTGLELGGPMTVGDRGELVPERATLYIDGEDYVLRKMEMEGETTSGAQPQPMTAEVTLTDYRNVEGLLHPFRLHIQATGAPTGMSQDELAEARANMAALEQQLESLPEGQRAMFEGMIKPQLEQLRKMVEEGEVDLTIITKEVRVNLKSP